MTASSTFKTLLVLLLVALMAAPAEAQRKKSSSKKDPLYPMATRDDREPKIQQRFGNKLNAIAKLSEDGKFEEVITESLAIANDSKAKEADRAVSYQNAAFGALELDDYDRASEYLKKAIAEDALSNDTHYQLMLQQVQIDLGEERYEEGLELLTRFLDETKSTKPDHLALKGNALYRMERYEEATTALEAAIKASDKPQDSWNQLLMASYSEMGKPEEASRVAAEIAARNPDDKRSMMNLAAIYAQADQLEQAIEVLESMRGKGMLTEERDYRQLYSMYLNLEGKEREAASIIKEGISKGILPESAEVYTHLAQSYYFSDQFDEAIEAYQKAAPLGEDGSESLNLARVLSNEARYSESKAAAQQALQRGLKKPGDAWIIIARAEYGLDNQSAMVAAYREAAKFPETQAQAQEWLRKSGKL